MTRYANYREIENSVDREKVHNAIQRIMDYHMSYYRKLDSSMKVTIDNGKVFFYSPPEEDPRFFIEVNPVSKSVKIILASADDFDRKGLIEPCREAPESGRREN